MTHGTRTPYTAGCRCGPCTEANTKRCAEYRDRQAFLGFVDLTHGKAGTYSAGCRCALCRGAASKAGKAYRLRRRERERANGGG